MGNGSPRLLTVEDFDYSKKDPKHLGCKVGIRVHLLGWDVSLILSSDFLKISSEVSQDGGGKEDHELSSREHAKTITICGEKTRIDPENIFYN